MIIEPWYLYLLAGASVLLGLVCGWAISEWARRMSIASRLELRTELGRQELVVSAAWVPDDADWLANHGMELRSET